MNTPGLGVQRIHITRIAAYKDPAIDNRLTVQRGRARKSESPFQFQTRHLSGCQSRRFGRLKSRIRQIPPAVPRGRVHVFHRRMRGANIRHILRIADVAQVEFPPAHVLCKQAFFVVAQFSAIVFMAPVVIAS